MKTVKNQENYTEEQISNTRRFVMLYSSIPEQEQKKSLEMVNARMDELVRLGWEEKQFDDMSRGK